MHEVNTIHWIGYTHASHWPVGDQINGIACAKCRIHFSSVFLFGFATWFWYVIWFQRRIALHCVRFLSDHAIAIFWMAFAFAWNARRRTKQKRKKKKMIINCDSKHAISKFFHININYFITFIFVSASSAADRQTTKEKALLALLLQTLCQWYSWWIVCFYLCDAANGYAIKSFCRFFPVRSFAK